ncbi:MAG: hypothetical protein O2818_08625 [Bacteroidetes bacterium]|nr:hypothetical protein [Bacteroidota bacterium]
MSRLVLLSFLLVATPSVLGQTPGQIFRTAVNDSLLDPNGDGWISATTSGFSDVPTIQDESEEFETSWNVLWHYELEPSSDLQTGSTCGPTEIVDNPNTQEHAAFWKVHDPDGIAGNEDELLLFRMRINSDPNNAAYGYSFLIDSDQKFGSSGPDADPNALSGNPGFEYEILFASGNSGGVSVNDVDGVAAHNAVTTLQSYADGVNDQRSYARFSNCSGATPIFIDFFIAFSDLGPAVTSNTTLRMLFASASSANSALNGSASDIGGVNDSNYPDDDSIFDTYITAVPTIQFSVGYSIVDVDGDGVDDASDNCTDLTACNYDGSVNNVACTFATTWYADTDADGAGDPATTQSACTQPAGYVAVAGDGCPSDPNKTAAGVCGCGVVDVDVDSDGVCDSSDNCTNLSACNYDGSVNNVACTFATTWYADTDSDGFGDASSSQSACTQPAGYVSNSTDCDDTDNSINALDACGVCGGSGPSTWYADTDNDGAGDPATTQSACTQPVGYVSVAGDGCPSDPNKTSAGVCGCGVVDVDIDSDGVCDSSDNCTNLSACNYDGSVNNVACTFATTWYADTDSDGFGDASSSQSACTQPVGYVSNSTDCDDTDNSINALDACGVCGGSGPSTWYADTDNDGFGDAASSQSACTQPAGYVSNSTDCDDTNNSINAVDACGVCGGAGPTTWYADDDSDGLGDSGDSQSACTQPVGYVSDNSDACDDLAATNFSDPGNAPCIYAAPTYTRLDSLWACEAQGNVTMDLDTMHVGTGSWSYSILTNIVGFAASSITANIIEFDFSAAGTGRDTVEISGTNGVNTASIEIIVQESNYPYYTSINPDGVSNPGVADGGSVFSFQGNHNLGVTVHYYKDAVMIIDGGVNKFMGYGEEFTLTSDANGNWTNLPTDAVWISGYTNAFGCYSPEPATTSQPTANPKIRQMPIPHLID